MKYLMSEISHNNDFTALYDCDMYVINKDDKKCADGDIKETWRIFFERISAKIGTIKKCEETSVVSFFFGKEEVKCMRMLQTFRSSMTVNAVCTLEDHAGLTADVYSIICR